MDTATRATASCCVSFALIAMIVAISSDIVDEAVAMETKEALAQVRKNAGLTQDEMAQRLFVTRQAISRWETGETTPGIDSLKLISKEFAVSVDALLGQSEFICQSCSMPLLDIDDFGTEADGGVSVEYCSHCFKDGDFTHDRTLEEMVESNLKHLDEYNAGNATNYTDSEARTILKMHLSTLKRWRLED